MVLKEAFRYQKFLDRLLYAAGESIGKADHCLKITKTHNITKANPDGEDKTEAVEVDGIFYPNDDVIGFMLWLVGEKEKLSEAVGKAKRDLAAKSFDLDAAIEANKTRQMASSYIRQMMRTKAYKKTEQGKGYKFNSEGNQAPYFYEVQVVAETAYDEKNAKQVMRKLIMEADEVSSKLDAALINTKVDYIPRFDVNESFEDVMAEFVKDKS